MNVGIKWFASVLMASLLGSAAVHAQPYEPYQLQLGATGGDSELRLSIGRSQIINSRKALEQVIIGSPDIADLKLLNSRQVLILGKQPGRTNLAFRGKGGAGEVVLIDVIVGYDLTGLKQKLNEVMPQERTIEVHGSNASVILSGQVSTALGLESALEIARSFVPAEKIVNSMSVGGSHQVSLEVKVSEISRTSLRELGLGLTIGDGETNSWSFITNPIVNSALGTLNLTQGYGTRGQNKIFNSAEMTMQALERKGLAKTLAEPNVVALSGQEASFLAGGEVPIPVDGGIEGISIDYKEFGVGLKFKPTVLSEGKINLKMKTEVSSIDTSSGFTIGGGFNIPSFSTRRTETTVEMADGQSFVIAGLLQSDANNLVSQLPLLGDLPILGALFRSTDFQRNETELMVMVTVRLVKPVQGEEISNLTDNFIPPNALDQYLMGSLQNKSYIFRNDKRDSNASAGLDGEFGHQLAEVR